MILIKGSRRQLSGAGIINCFKKMVWKLLRKVYFADFSFFKPYKG